MRLVSWELLCVGRNEWLVFSSVIDKQRFSTEGWSKDGRDDKQEELNSR